MTVRVRIAPSPTGTPHVGTAYIALFNYCFARSQGGQMVLRIEDTDQQRSHSSHEQAIIDALHWTGIQWDEGPDVGGPFGPYRQSERNHIYRQYADQLLQAGHAYRCFCSADTLDQIRSERFKQGLSTGYDGRCAALSTAEVTQRMQAGEAHTLRLRVPDEGVCRIDDPLRGTVEIDYAVVDHQVLLKSDGFPTYHLANVVDDHLMEISHVIRGEEWLPSLPKHLLLYQYFGWQAPQVYHVPLLRNADKSKLSKRKNPTSILYYRDLGIIPEALLNFLGLMAYSMADGQEVFSLDEMVGKFDIARINLGGPVFDLDKLTWLNQQHLAQMSDAQLVGRLVDWRFNQETLSRLIPLVNKRMHRLGDFMELCDFVFYSQVQYETEMLIPKKREPEATRDTLQCLVWALEEVTPFASESLEATFRDVAQQRDWSIRDLTHIARVAISGKTVAPPLFGVMDILGSDLCRNRLVHAIQLLGPLGKKKLAALEKEFRALRTH